MTSGLIKHLNDFMLVSEDDCGQDCFNNIVARWLKSVSLSIRPRRKYVVDPEVAHFLRRTLTSCLHN
jgi:hypothetical protein